MPTVFLLAAFISTGFGGVTSGLQLAVKIDSKGASATFRVRNVGTKAVTFVEEYSCSKRAHFSISAGRSNKQLNTHYHYEPAVRGMTTVLKTVCTVNVPTKQRTVGPGRTVSVVIPFAKVGSILSSPHKVFRANALLTIKGQVAFTHLKSAFVRR